MSPRLPVQRLTPSPPRPTPGITSPYQLQRVKTASLVPGRGPLNTGREWRTESASPWSTTSTTACRYEEQDPVAKSTVSARVSPVNVFNAVHSAVLSPAGEPLPGGLVPTSRRHEARGSHATALPAGLPASRTGLPTPRSGLPERSAR